MNCINIDVTIGSQREPAVWASPRNMLEMHIPIRSEPGGGGPAFCVVISPSDVSNAG